MVFLYKSVLTVGLQILAALCGGWTAAHVKAIDPEVYISKLNQFSVKVLCPCLGIWVLGIKTTMRDIDTWRVIGVFCLWNTLVQLACAAYVRLREPKFIAGYALYSTVLSYNNTGIIGPVMCVAVLGPSMVSLGMLVSIPMFLQQVTLLLYCFEAHTLQALKDGEMPDEACGKTAPLPLANPQPANPHVTADIGDLKHGKIATLPSLESPSRDIVTGDKLTITCTIDQATYSRSASPGSDTDTHPPAHHSHPSLPQSTTDPPIHLCCELTAGSLHPAQPPPASTDPSAPTPHKPSAAASCDAGSPSTSFSGACGVSSATALPPHSPPRRAGGVAAAVQRLTAAFVAVIPARERHLIAIIFLNPLIVSMLLGILISLAGLNRYLDPDQPDFVWQLGFVEATMGWFARAAAPLTVFTQGLWLHGKVRVSTWTPGAAGKIAVFVLLRLALMPFTIAVVAKYCGLDDKHCLGLLVMTAIPVGQFAFVFAEQYGIGVGFVTALMIICTFTMLPHVIVILEVVQRLHLFEWSPPQ